MVGNQFRKPFLYITYCRIYQRVLQVASYLVFWRKPELLEGPGSIERLPGFIAGKKVKKILIVTDSGISSSGLLSEFLCGLEKLLVGYVIYDKTVADPTMENAEEALALYIAAQAEAIVAFGGGSSIDCAKGVGARIARPDKSLWEMKGLLRVRKKLPLLIAVPTTAGTGSEVTIAAVISDPAAHAKFQINDPSLIPRAAVLDPLLTARLPANFTAMTAMDALTHAVEAYIGRSNTHETKIMCKNAVTLIFNNIRKVYSDGTDIGARYSMLKASHYAGIAFTRAYIGYVHAMAHILGGMYGVSHGLANAIILPHVLEYYGKAIHKQLAELLDVSGIGNPLTPPEQRADEFIQAIKELNKSLNIPDRFAGMDKADIPLMAALAVKEANPFYPVPKILFEEDLVRLFHIICE